MPETPIICDGKPAFSKDWKSIVTSDKWKHEGQCSCGGTMTVKYEYWDGCGIKLRVKPTKKRFNLYSTLKKCKGNECKPIMEWDKPLSELQDTLNQHGLC